MTIFKEYDILTESDDFTAWMNRARIGFNTRRLLLSSGLSLSIQAGEFHYCFPRSNEDGYGRYYSFEIGFPSMYVPEFIEYAESPDTPTESVYGYVPKDVIHDVIERHGSVVGYGSESTHVSATILIEKRR